MGSADIGQAIALGNIGSIDRSKPLTNAILNKQKMDLYKLQTEAKAAKDKQDQVDKMAALINFDSKGFLPFMQDEVAAKTAEATYKMMNSTSMVQAASNRELHNQYLANQTQVNDNLKRFVNSSSTGGYVPQELAKIPFLPKKEGLVELARIHKEHPEYKNILDVDANGNLQPNFVSDINVQPTIEAAIPKLKMGARVISSKTLPGGRIEETYQASPEDLNDQAISIAGQKDMPEMIRQKYNKRYNEEEARLKKEFESKGLTPSANELRDAAAVSVIKSLLPTTFVGDKGVATPSNPNAQSGATKSILDKFNFQAFPGEAAEGLANAVVVGRTAGSQSGFDAAADFIKNNPNAITNANTITLPTGTKEVSVYNERTKQNETMRPELMVYVDANNPDYAGWYMLGTSSKIDAGDVSVNGGGVKFNKAVKVNDKNHGSLATAIGVQEKDAAAKINGLLEENGSNKRYDVSVYKAQPSTTKKSTAPTKTHKKGNAKHYGI